MTGATRTVRVSTDLAPAGSAQLFILSFHHRDALGATAERGGWKVLAARRVDNLEQRFVNSGASIAVVDARGALDQGIAALDRLGDPVQALGGALIALLSPEDKAALPRILTAGATHFIVHAFDEVEFTQLLRFANRLADRIARHPPSRHRDSAARGGEVARWRLQPGASTAMVSAALADRLGIASEVEVPVGRMFRAIGRSGRRSARLAIDRLLTDRRATAFAHGGGEEGERVAHHLHFEEATGTIVGRLEDLDPQSHRLEASHRDPLTGFADGHGARRWIEARMRSQGGFRPRCVLLMLSVTRFDMVNAAFGRAVGDLLLKGVARRIERLVAQSGPRRWMVARIAGAEFAIGLGGPVTIAQAVLLADQLTETVSSPFVEGDHVVTLSCRVGLAAAEDSDQEASQLLRRAGAALTDAIGGEGGAVRLLDASGEARSAQDSQLEVDLRHALDQDEIELRFQPQVSVASGQVVGVEALARWRHPSLGELGAAPLFAAAERSDYLRQLSAHIQRKAIALAAAWPDTLSHLRIAVNVTSADIVRPGFAERFAAMVDEVGMARQRITVEITESGLIEDLGAAATLLAALRNGGFRVAIDDFGTGYSSLAYLKALPLDYLKLDKRLSQDIDGSARDRVVVRGVIEMARSLGLAVVAEGVETQAQLGLLARAGCNYYQGFLCAPPVDAAEVERLVVGEQRAAG